MTRSSVLLPLPDGPSRATQLAAGDGQIDASSSTGVAAERHGDVTDLEHQGRLAS